MSDKRIENKYQDEISLLPQEAAADYIRLNLRKIQSHRRKFDIPVICIAGSEGKTSTKRMLSAILKDKFNLLETPPNCSTASGVTSTLLRLKSEHQVALLELGIINSEQFRLAVEISEPTIGLITNIGESHLASQGDKYIIADAKVELVRNLPKDGFAILNIDDDLVSGMAAYSNTRRVIKFGLNQNAQFFAGNIEYLGPGGVAFDVNGFYRFHLPIYSSTSIYNALAAISIARVLGVDFEEIRRGLEREFSLREHTGNLITMKYGHILDYSYDATINSVTKACESLVQFAPFASKLTLVIGEISNPGPRPQVTHTNMGYYIAALPIDCVITIGENARFIAEGIQRLSQNRKSVAICKDETTLQEELQKSVQTNSCMLFIGSKRQAMDESLQTFLNTLRADS